MERVLRKFRENNYQKMTSLIDIYKSSLDAYDKLKLLLNKHDNNDDDNYETKLDIEEKLENCSAILTKLSFILGSVYYHSENIEGMKNDTLKIFEQDSVQLPKLRDIIKGRYSAVQKKQYLLTRTRRIHGWSLRDMCL